MSKWAINCEWVSVLLQEKFEQMNLFLSEILCLVVDDVEVEFWSQEISLGLNVANVNLHAATFYHDAC